MVQNMRQSNVCQSVVVGIILLFVGTSISPMIAQDVHKYPQTFRGDRLYVGGDGPGNYTTIQSAIDATKSGDTVFVYDDSSPYLETILVDKSITIQGENMYTTIIGWVFPHDYVLTISSDNVTISSFTFTGCQRNSVRLEYVSNTIIEYCIFDNNKYGISLLYSGENNCIRNCSFFSNYLTGIYISGWNMRNIEISYCDFFNNTGSYEEVGAIGIFQSTRGIKIHHCNITNNANGIYIGGPINSDIQITSNNIVNNDNNNRYGLWFLTSFPLFIDVRDNWWGTRRGPTIKISLYPFYISNYENYFTIWNFRGSETVLFFGLKTSLVGLTRIYPWRHEPVLDAGQQTTVLS